MKHISVAKRAAGAALAVTLLVAAGCGDDDDTAAGGGANASEVLGPEAPASGEPVKVGLISDGPNGVTDMAIEMDVADAAVQYFNEHHSGIGGRPIELVTCASETDPARSVDCANQMVEENVVGVIVGALSAAENVWAPLDEAQIPVMFYAVNSAQMLTDPDSTFILSNPGSATVGTPISAAQDAGESKVTVVVIDVPAALSVYESIAPAAFEEAGLELEVVPVPPGTADMTPQMQQVADSDPGLVQVVGNDTFCISAFQGLQAVGFDGQVTTISQCLSDSTRQAVPAEFLDGMIVSATAPVGAENPSTELYEAVVDTYGGDIDTSRSTGMNMFITVAGFMTALDGLSGDVTPESVTSTIKGMDETELPGSGGLTYRCNGEAVPRTPAVCTTGALVTTLDAEGQPAEYEVVNQEPAES
jgi:branched-chain amino acid transport system substrate-binding protein